VSDRSVGQHHGDLRRALLDAALALVAETSVQAVSMRAVARRAGVSSGAPYHHFADKAALIAAVATEGFHALRVAQEEATRSCTSADDTLRQMATTYVRFAVAHRTHYQLMFQHPPGTLDHAAREDLRAASLAAFGALAAAIGAVRPELPEGAVQERAVLGWALAHGAVDVAQWIPAPGSEADSPLAGISGVDALADRVGAAVLALARA